MDFFNEQEISRYSRHFLLDEVGESGQMKLKKSSALIIGAGGLGSPIGLYLAAIGVGRIGIMDFDSVEESNLNRQIVHSTESIGQKKVDSTVKRLVELNPYIEVMPYNLCLTAENALSIFKDFDVIIDGSDNFSTKYLVNDASFLSKKPLISGSILRFMGQISVFNYENGPCYRCLFPVIPDQNAAPNCSEAGVLGVLAGTIGCLQATEAVKILLGIGEVASGILLVYNALSVSFEKFKISKDIKCGLCGINKTIFNLDGEYNVCDFKIQNDINMEITASEFESIKLDVTLIDVRDECERASFHIKNSLHIPLQELCDKLRNFNKSHKIVLYCETGTRSLYGAKKLLGLGFSGVRSLKNGVLEFKKPTINC